jgi:hypothetical protein
MGSKCKKIPAAGRAHPIRIFNSPFPNHLPTQQWPLAFRRIRNC